MGLLPYVAFARRQRSPEAFKSAFDEDTYLLGDTSAPYRFLSDGFVGAIDFATPDTAWLMIATDILIPCLVVSTAWLLVTRIANGTAFRVLSVLLLLFGQELFSLANSIVWPGGAIVTLRELAPPTTSTLVPDATTSYMNLFRTPEPAVGWALLFGFLALISRPDPLAVFEKRLRYLMYLIFVVLGFAYPFSSVPILLMTSVLFVWAFLHVRSRSRPIGLALVVGAASFLLAMLISSTGERVSGASVAFASRLPVLTPALFMGTLVCASFLFFYRAEVLRRLDLLIPFTAALLPVAISNQQLISGSMVSTRDWERYANYQLVMFSLICLLASLRSDRLSHLLKSRRMSLSLRVGAWIMVLALGTQLVRWQREVYDVWLPTNAEAHRVARLLDGLSGQTARYPVALENTALVPLVRLLTDDRHSFVIDYTRLFKEPVPSFADGTPSDQAGPRRDELFELAYRLDWSPARLEDQIQRELVGDAGGFYGHFVYALEDVWAPVTDNRHLRVDEALNRLPHVRDAYSAYLQRRANEGPGPPVLIVSRQPLVRRGERRINRLIASVARSSEVSPAMNVYVQMAVPRKRPLDND